jgi:hypothetical protein
MENQIIQTFRDNNFISGRMISYSKSTYRDRFPENEVYFNANIFVEGEGKVFYGDLDITKDRETLKQIASSIGKDLYVLSEMDGRFENESLSEKDMKSKARAIITR